MRALDNNRSGHVLGPATLVALAGSLLEKNTEGGVVVGQVNFGGSLGMGPNPVAGTEK